MKLLHWRDTRVETRYHDTSRPQRESNRFGDQDIGDNRSYTRAFGDGPRVAAVAEWYRYRIVACLVTSSIPVPLKTRRVGQRCTLNLSRAETSSRWCGVVVRRGGCQLRCRPRHLTMVQNYVVRRQKPSCS
ncbi:uncharacterized protein TNCV_2706121 [Trichonephila clavipes]|nr:uncharacterized protein TNCV_2706121 [Trichonephila clavipes]